MSKFISNLKNNGKSIIMIYLCINIINYINIYISRLIFHKKILKYFLLNIIPYFDSLIIGTRY